MNFENPTPEKKIEQQASRFSLKEIQIKLTEIIGHDRYQEFASEKTTETHPDTYEVIVVEENGDESLYTFQQAGTGTETTQISVGCYSGKVTAGEVSGGEILAEYDKTTRTWRYFKKNPITAQPIMEATPHQTTHITEEHILAETQEQSYQNMLAKFNEAEAVFGTISLEETLRREEENMELALERRAAARPYLTAIYTELVRLNDDASYPPQLKLTVWHASGHLTEEQFDELNLRRKKLANLLGALNNGKIRHDLNPL